MSERIDLGRGDASGGGGLTGEEAVEVVSRLQHGPVSRDVGLRAQDIESLPGARGYSNAREGGGGWRG